MIRGIKIDMSFAVEDADMVAVKGTIISRPKDENIVMVSEKEYTELERLKRNAEYLGKIDRAIAQKEAGTMKEHD